VRLIGMEVENYKKLKVFRLTPKGNVIKITGANASGKSSVLDAIQAALVGARGGPSKPVREGAGHATVRLDLEDYWVTRKWKEGGESIGEMWIEAKDGRRYSTPQKMLDTLMGKISFDPLAFMRMEPKEQVTELRRLLDIDEILFDLQAKEKVDYQTRTEQAKMLKQLEAQRLAIQYPENLPKKKRDIDAMTQELADVSTYNMAIERERMNRESIQRQHQAIIDSAKAKAERMKELRAEIERVEISMHQDLDAIEMNEKQIKAWKPLAAPKDAQKISEEIAAARAVNIAIDRKIEADAKDAEIERVSKQVASLSRAIDDHRQKQADAIATAHYPVKGLGFAENEVLYQGLPFTQASNAEQIKVSIAMGMEGNPELRVMRIKDGSLLDEESMQVVEDMAEKYEFQVLIEIVDNSGKIGVYLVDGEIAAIDGEKPPAPPSNASNGQRSKSADAPKVPQRGPNPRRRGM
jgi:recombinational DNA repair ATPase RecF